MDNQVKKGYFGKPLVRGKAVGAQKGLVDKINKLCEVLENIAGLRGCKIYKPESGAWHINPSDAGSPIGDNDSMAGEGGVPPGYAEMQNAVVDVQWVEPESANAPALLQVKRGKVLVKDVGEWETVIDFARYDA